MYLIISAYCVDIENTKCTELLPYQKTYFPNDFMPSQQQANDLIMEHLPQITSNCTEAEQLALCRSMYPECPRFGPVRVCSSSCLEALACAGVNSNSSTLQCDVYPDHSSSSDPGNSCGFDAGGMLD